MCVPITVAVPAALLLSSPLLAQTTRNPFPAAIRSDDVTVVAVTEFALLPAVDGVIGRSAATGVVVYRSDRIPQLTGRVLFGD